MQFTRSPILRLHKNLKQQHSSSEGLQKVQNHFQLLFQRLKFLQEVCGIDLQYPKKPANIYQSTNENDLEDFLIIIIVAMIWKSFLKSLLAKKKMLHQTCHKLFFHKYSSHILLMIWKTDNYFGWILTSDLVNNQHNIMLFRWPVRVTDTLSILYFWYRYYTCAIQ